MTEDEHKRLFCPDARVIVTLATNGLENHSVAANRRSDGKAIAAASCLVSQCAAWRWSDNEFETTRTAAGVEPQGHGWTQIESVPSVDLGRCTHWKRPLGPRRRGFCGKYEPVVQL
jgi:hypothetical protein